jgi:hypothetical protein
LPLGVFTPSSQIESTPFGGVAPSQRYLAQCLRTRGVPEWPSRCLRINCPLILREAGKTSGGGRKMARRYYVRHISHPRDNLFATRSLRSYKNFFRDGLHLNSSGVAAVACELAAFSAGVGGGERKGGTGTDLIFLYMTEVDRFHFHFIKTHFIVQVSHKCATKF